MNILIFSAIYPAPAKYGIPNDTKVVHYYAKQWKEAGHNIQVVYLHMISVKKIFKKHNLPKCNGFESDYELDGIPVHLLEYQLLLPKRNYLSAFQAKDAEQRIVAFIRQSFAPDKVFVHFPCSFKGIKCLSDFACPTMAVLHNVDINTLKKKMDLCGEIERYQNIGGRNKRICITIAELLSRKSSLVLSGIDGALIPSYEFTEQKISRSSQRIKIVYAGNLIKLKKVDAIIKALAHSDFEYQFDIIGDGPEKKNLMSMAHGNSKIVFRGRMSREDTIEKMREADVFVMVSSPETFGLVYLEAMAQGCLTVGSKNEGIDGIIVQGENGFLVTPGNAKELAACLKSIADMEFKQKKKIIQSAYNTAINMTDHKMSMHYFQLNK